jgi:hypothetical protein
MRVIKSDSSGVYIYKKILKDIHSHECKIIIWQFNPETKERRISESKINSVHLESGVLNFIRPENYDLKSELPLYFYSEEEQVIFKSEIRELMEKNFSIHTPSEIKLLDEEDVTIVSGTSGINISTLWKSRRSNYIESHQVDMMRVKSLAERSSRDQDFLNQEFHRISLDEEDRLFADKRESPRGKPVLDKWIKIGTLTDENVYDFKIFDLSRGGVGFITEDTSPFPKGSKVKILAFDDFILDDPLYAEVMSHRPLDMEGIGTKIGCKFDSGQD